MKTASAIDEHRITFDYVSSVFVPQAAEEIFSYALTSVVVATLSMFSSEKNHPRETKTCFKFPCSVDAVWVTVLRQLYKWAPILNIVIDITSSFRKTRYKHESEIVMSMLTRDRIIQPRIVVASLEFTSRKGWGLVY